MDQAHSGKERGEVMEWFWLIFDSWVAKGGLAAVVLAVVVAGLAAWLDPSGPSADGCNRHQPPPKSHG